MESFFQKRKLAREYVRQLLQSNLNAQSRHQIFDALKQFRRRNIFPSTAVAAVHNLLRDHADLLPAFDPFMPSIVAAEEESIMQSSLDFLNRVRTRFPGGRIYKEFLNCLHSHSRGETSFSQIYDHVIRLFGDNQDLVSDFQSFLQLSSDQQQISCKKRKADSPMSSNEKRNCKKRKSNSPIVSSDQKSCKKRKSDVDEEKTRFPDSRRKEERIKSNNQNIDNSMEDSLFEVDVELGNVRATLMIAEQLKERLSDGRISPADVRLDEHFTPLNVACIRHKYRKFFDDYENPISAMRELIVRLKRKGKEVEESRERICQKWNRIRQSRDPKRIFVI